MTEANEPIGQAPSEDSSMTRELTGLFIPPIFLVLLFALWLASGEELASGRAVVALVATYFAESVLYGYNNYRGREEDAASPKRAVRPLAGRSARVPRFEVLLVAVAVASVLLPLAIGEVAQAAMNAVATGGYALAFQNRYARRPSALLKPTSAVVSVLLTVVGLVVALDAPAETVIDIAIVVAIWRIVFELVWDALDADSDRTNGITTPVTRWGQRRVLTTVGLAGGTVYAVAAAVLGVGDTDRTFVLAATVVAVLVGSVLILSGVAVWRWNDRDSWDAMRIVANIVLSVGLARVIMVERAWWWGVPFLVFTQLPVVKYVRARVLPWLRQHLRDQPAGTVPDATSETRGSSARQPSDPA